MQDGTSKGNEPTIKVLEIAQNPDRKADDLLPYLGAFAKFFRNLPERPEDLILRTAYVPLSAIECFTKTIIDVPESVTNLNKKKESLKLAQAQFLPLCQSWNYEDWDEFDYSRIKNLKFLELMEARVKEGQTVVDKKSLECPDFLKHFELEHDQWLIKENILSLRQLMSDQNLQLLPDYEQRTRVLKDLGFIDDGSRVELKGKVACEVCIYPTLSLHPLTNHPDPLRRRARPNRTRPRKRSRRLHARRNRRFTLRLRLPRENRRGAHAHGRSNPRRRRHRQDLGEGKRDPDGAPGHPLRRRLQRLRQQAALRHGRGRVRVGSRHELQPHHGPDGRHGGHDCAGDYAPGRDVQGGEECGEDYWRSRAVSEDGDVPGTHQAVCFACSSSRSRCCDGLALLVCVCEGITLTGF
jgi:hypothetical protein